MWNLIYQKTKINQFILTSRNGKDAKFCVFTFFIVTFRIHFLFFVSYLGAIGCTKNTDKYDTVYQHYGIDNPVSIDIDKDVINLYPKDFDYFINEESQDSILGNGKFLEAINDSILYVVVQNQLLKKVNIKSLSIEKELIFKGNGPGEYNYIDNIIRLGTSLFILDKGMYKLIEYDFDLNHIKDIKLMDVETVNQRSTGTVSSKFFYYPIHLNKDYLYSRINLNDKTSVNYHKRFIPIGKQPIAYNGYLQSINSKNELMLTSNKMPLFFIYDKSLQIKNLYKLVSRNIDKMETSVEDKNSIRIVNPPPKIIDSKNRISFTGFSIIDAIITDDQIFIYFSNRFISDRYLIALKRNGDSWVHSGNYRFLKEPNDLFTIFDMTFSDPWLYLSSQFEEGIIRIDTQEL